MLRFARSLVELVSTLIVILLVLRLVMKLFDAKPVSLVNWVYETSAYFLAPFMDIFSPLHMGRFTIEMTTFFAIFIYSIAAGLLIRFLRRSEVE